jgi:hypothetical protein
MKNLKALSASLSNAARDFKGKDKAKHRKQDKQENEDSENMFLN